MKHATNQLWIIPPQHWNIPPSTLKHSTHLTLKHSTTTLKHSDWSETLTKTRLSRAEWCTASEKKTSSRRCDVQSLYCVRQVCNASASSSSELSVYPATHTSPTLSLLTCHIAHILYSLFNDPPPIPSNSWDIRPHKNLSGVKLALDKSYPMDILYGTNPAHCHGGSDTLGGLW